MKGKGKMNGKMNEIDKKTISTLIMTMLMLSMVGAAIPAMGGVDPATTWYVADDGNDGGLGTEVDPFLTIQFAINSADAGDTISVAAGAYSENVVVNRTLTLHGASSATVTVAAADAGISVFTVTADGVEISGFTVSGATGGGQAGIYIGALVADCDISDNVLTNNFDGIWLGSGSHDNTFTSNTVTENLCQGFEVYISSDNTFTNNNASSNTKYGFKIDSGDNNTFTGNTANSNGDKGFYSVGKGGGSTNSIFINNIANLNTRHGIHLIGSNVGATLTGNTFNGNLVTGIKLQDIVTGLTVNDNTITNNGIGISTDETAFGDSCEISYNDIVGNGLGVDNLLGNDTLSATLNYWGHPTGPSGEGTGDGDAISVDVNYIPWLNAVSGDPVEQLNFDSEFYVTGSTVTVTLYYDAANADPIRTETKTVHVVSTHDTVGIEANVRETGVNTGIFTGTFLLVDTDDPEPGVDDLGVDDGDIITATYESYNATAIVDDTPPTITGLTPTDESLVNIADPNISATLDDAAGSGINVVSVIITVDGEDVTEDATITTSSVTYTPADLTDGNHTVTVDASDNLGNEATTESWSFIVDTTPPTVVVSVDKDPANATTVTFTLTFNEDMDVGTEPTVTITTDVNTWTVTGDWSDDSVTEWVGTYDVDGDTGDGAATISVSAAVDPAGNEMAADTGNTFMIDTLAPDVDEDDLVVSMNAPGVNDTIAGIDDAVEANATVNVYSDDGLTLLIGSATADEEGSFPAISIGDNTNAEVWVTATDAAGNEGIATSMENDIVEPEITSVTWIADADPVRTGENITVTLMGEEGCVATFDIGTIAFSQPMTETVNGTYVGNYTVVPGDDGEWTVTGNLTDAAGNTDSDAADGEVTIITDEVDPVIVSTDVTYPIGVYSARVDDTFVVEAVVTDDLTGVETVTVDGTPMELVGDTWTVNLYYDDADPGTYNLTITATDLAGNEATATVTVVVTTSLTGYNVNLVEGWNLVSLPLIPDNSSIVAVLGDANSVTEVVWSYDAEAMTWYMYSSNASELSDLSAMVDGKGYWIKTTEATTLVIDGVEEPLPPQTPPSYAVVEGWNLIGFKETYDLEASAYLLGIEGKYVQMYTYEDEAFGFRHIDPGEMMTPGRGYWLALTGEGYIYP